MTTEKQTPAELAEEIKRLADDFRCATLGIIFKTEQALHAAIDRLAALASAPAEALPRVNLQEDGSVRRFYINPENGHVVETTRGPWVRYVDHRAELAASAPQVEALTDVRMRRLDAAMKRLDKEGPLPGMISAFETRFGQSWHDPDWRQETAVFACAWRATMSAKLVWPESRDVARLDDMSPDSYLRVLFDSDNDVVVSVYDGKRAASVEFCNPGACGGGQSSHTRMALIALMCAIERDNAERPSRAVLFAAPPATDKDAT